MLSPAQTWRMTPTQNTQISNTYQVTRKLKVHEKSRIHSPHWFVLQSKKLIQINKGDPEVSNVTTVHIKKLKVTL